MKSSKMSKGRIASKKVGNHWFNQHAINWSHLHGSFYNNSGKFFSIYD